MKRTPLKRTKGLTSKSELKTTKPLTSTTKIKHRSKKMEKVYVERRLLVSRLLQERPDCEVKWDSDCNGTSTDVHERLPRSLGGRIVGGEETEYVATCRSCHTKLTDSPMEARRRGWVIQSWEAE